MKKNYYLGTDIGTSSCKTVIIDSDGKVLSEASKEYWPTYSDDTMAEIDPEVWFKSFLETLKASCSKVNINPADISGIGVTGQMVTLVCLDKNGDSLRPAILWYDKRGSQYLEELDLNLKQIIKKITSNPINSTFTLPKLLWVKYNEPDIYKKIYKILWASDYIRMKLTDTFFTDATNASSSLMYDLNSNEWSKKILDFFAISEKKLPDVLPASEVIGRVSLNISEISGLKAGTPVIVGTGDIGADNISAGIINVGQGIIRFGTCATISICTNTPLLDNNDKCPCSSHSIPGLYLIQGTSASFGDSIRWLKNTFYPDIHVYDLIDKEVSEVNPFSSSLFFHSFTKSAPYWINNIKGQFIGIDSNHRRGHFARALFEGISFDLKEALVNLKKIKGIKIPDTFFALGGGTKSEVLCNIVSNILGCNMVLVDQVNASIGVAILAFIGVNNIKDYKKYITNFIKYSGEVSTDIELLNFYKERFILFRKIHNNLREMSDKIF